VNDRAHSALCVGLPTPHDGAHTALCVGLPTPHDGGEVRRPAPSAVQHVAGPLLLLLLAAALPMELSCRRPVSSQRARRPTGPEDVRMQQKLFDEAIASISNYPRYDSPEWLQHAVGRLDQWVQGQQSGADWQVDPLVATLPKPLGELSEVPALDQLEFPNADAYAFQEVAWLRDVSNWARGDAVDELSVAQRLFDWTVRNVQIEPVVVADASGRPVLLLKHPWETLLLGSGVPADRAWLFILLARQQGIDAALLALVDPDDPDARQTQAWVVAVLSQGELYLFEPTLGVPIPAPDGVKQDEAGRLEIRPATLTQVAADDALLRQLDVDGRRYPVSASQVERVVALVEASPAYLSRRMKLVESQLAGDERMVLTTDAAAQAERFRACEHVVDARLWELPYQTLQQERQIGPERLQWLGSRIIRFRVPFDVSEVVQKKPKEVPDGADWWTIEAREQADREAEEGGQTGSDQDRTFGPALWRGRLLHFQGQFTGEQSATYYYARARLPNRDLQSPEIDPNLRAVLTWAKMDASYWLGLIAAHQGNTEAAIDWLATRTLEPFPNGPWTPGAKYNLGRVYEADGQIAKAVEAYRSDADSPARHGNLLRARWLQPSDTSESTGQPPTDKVKSPAADATKPPADEGTKQPTPKASGELPGKTAEGPRTDSPESPAAASDEQ